MQADSVCQHNTIPKLVTRGSLCKHHSLSLTAKLDLAVSKHFALGYMEKIKAFCMAVPGALITMLLLMTVTNGAAVLQSLSDVQQIY